MARIVAWLDASDGAIVALATIVLAVFAAIQLAQERARKKDARSAAQRSLYAQVRIVRRSLDSLFRESYDQRSARILAEVLTPSLDRLQSEFLEAMRLAGMSSKSDAEAVTRAFECFLAFSDHLRLVRSVIPTAKDTHGFVTDYEEDERAAINVHARNALTNLRVAANELASLAPRPDHEQGLLESRVPLLAAGRALREVNPNFPDGAA